VILTAARTGEALGARPDHARLDRAGQKRAGEDGITEREVTALLTDFATV
jgi:hypothetical protein